MVGSGLLITDPMNAVTFTALPGLPEIHAGHDLARLIVDAAASAEVAPRAFWSAPETSAAALLRPKEKDLFQ